MKWQGHEHFMDKSLTPTKQCRCVSANGIDFGSYTFFGFITLTWFKLENKDHHLPPYNII